MSNNIQSKDSRNLDFHAIYADFLASPSKSKRKYYDKYFNTYLSNLNLAEYEHMLDPISKEHIQGARRTLFEANIGSSKATPSLYTSNLRVGVTG